MSAPDKIWAEPDGGDIIVHNGADDLEGLIATGCLYEYVRADLLRAQLATARNEAIEQALGCMIFGARFADTVAAIRALIPTTKEAE